MKKLILFFFFITINLTFSMDKSYHHKSDGTFQNPKGSPKIEDYGFKWSYKVFNDEKKKIKIQVPKEHIEEKKILIKKLNDLSDEDYVAWIGHATFIMKLGNITLITDPVFEKNMGPLIFGPKRYVDPALGIEEIPEINLFLLTHNHYDHLSTRTIQKFPYKKAKVLTPLKLSKYFKRNGFLNVEEMDWYETTIVNDLKITLLPAVHWSKRSIWDTNKTLWGSFLIEYKNKKIFFSCDTGYGEIYKELGKKFGPIDLTFINIGAYNFYPMSSRKDQSIYHTNPEQALQIGRDLKSKKIFGMHWGTVVLSLEPIFEPPKRFKKSAYKYGFNENDAIIFKIGQIESLENLIK